jgi:hypothetical protein
LQQEPVFIEILVISNANVLFFIDKPVGKMQNIEKFTNLKKTSKDDRSFVKSYRFLWIGTVFS